MKKQSIKVVVSALNSNGCPDFYCCKILCSNEQLENGEHYRAAHEVALENGYGPYLCYDEFESAGKILMNNFDWTSVTEREI
jgi:hypothetical protein